MGAPSAPTLDFCGSATAAIAGAAGLCIIVQSNTPSGKGRTKKKIANGSAAGAGASAAGAGASAEVPAGGEEDLPPAPSDFVQYHDASQLRALLVKDFARLLKLGDAWENRFPQPVTFRFQGAPNVQAVCIQPATKMVWQAMQLIGDWELNDITPPEHYVELGAGSASAARKGEVICKPKRDLVNKNGRYQRGQSFFTRLFQDLSLASQRLSAEDGRKHPILFGDVSSWGGDSMDALRAYFPESDLTFLGAPYHRIDHPSLEADGETFIATCVMQ